ncbi:MAG: hypothetical protein Q7W45_12775 [Bacteroidota bacterium]|nr:hypothetical protein [Bacteroidota bacterium]MDP3146798.1 hypothetical protein [Bacteroidota bacterium]
MKKIYTAFLKDRFFIFFTLLIILLFFINRYMYINRFSGYLYTERLNYNEFYYSEKTLRVQGFQAEQNDSLKIKILPLPKKSIWIIKDSKGNSYTVINELPTIKLLKGKANYTLTASGDNNLPVITLEIESLPEQEYTDVLFCSLPLLEYQLFPIERWTKLNKTISENEINEVKKIIKNEILITDSNTTLEKLEKIGLYLVSKLRSAEGAPSGEIKQLSPLTQYNLACSKKDEIDCGNYADIFHLFANCAGIPTRKIGVAGWIDYITTSGHVFNESYISEQEKWAFVDLTSKKLMVLNSTNEVLNTIDLLNARISKTFEGKTAIVVNSKNEIDSVPYAQINQAEDEHFKRTASFYIIKEDINNEMNFKETFKEYLSTTSHYGPYYNGTIKVDNSKHYLKLYTFQISVFLFFIWGFVLAVKLILGLLKSVKRKII